MKRYLAQFTESNIRNGDGHVIQAANRKQAKCKAYEMLGHNPIRCEEIKSPFIFCNPGLEEDYRIEVMENYCKD